MSDPSELYARRMTPKKVEDSLVWEHYDVLRWDLKELPVGFQWAYGEQGERKGLFNGVSITSIFKKSLKRV